MAEKLTKIEELSIERKESIKAGNNPEWLTTPGWQLLSGRYLTEEDNDLKKTFTRISSVCASHMPKDQKKWEKTFFDLMWSGDLALSTPVISNLGTNKGLPVSCQGSFVGDSVHAFYESTGECAVLSQEGFGTSSYLGAIRPRGAVISRGGTASGVLPVVKQFVQMSRDITQGTRRGSWAGYLEITHGDFWELVNYLEHNPQDLNLGWIIPDSFIEQLQAGDEDAMARYKRALKIKLVTGKGYFLFVDRANAAAPKEMRDLGLTIKASNLCSEIMLPSDEDHSFTCVLSSMNAARYDEWAPDAVFNSSIFLDCVVSEFLARAKGIHGMEKTIRFTEKARSLGLGVLGFHTLVQKKSFAFSSIDTIYLNAELFKLVQDESHRASRFLAEELGEPEWLKGTGKRNLHSNAIAPNTSSGMIAGSVSPGIEPMYANAFLQSISGGEVSRVNPALIPLMKEKGVYNQKTIDIMLRNEGSVQDVDWLTDHEKSVFLTAFEIDQKVIIRLASQRQRWIDQGQSLNLFFAADCPEEEIARVHQLAFLDERILALYYIRSSNSNKASSGEAACESCAS